MAVASSAPARLAAQPSCRRALWMVPAPPTPRSAPACDVPCRRRRRQRRCGLAAAAASAGGTTAADLKERLLQAVSRSNNPRPGDDLPALAAAVEDAAAALAATNPTPDAALSPLLPGAWALLYSGRSRRLVEASGMPTSADAPGASLRQAMQGASDRACELGQLARRLNAGMSMGQQRPLAAVLSPSPASMTKRRPLPPAVFPRRSHRLDLLSIRAPAGRQRRGHQSAARGGHQPAGAHTGRPSGQHRVSEGRPPPRAPLRLGHRRAGACRQCARPCAVQLSTWLGAGGCCALWCLLLPPASLLPTPPSCRRRCRRPRGAPPRAWRCALIRSPSKPAAFARPGCRWRGSARWVTSQQSTWMPTPASPAATRAACSCCGGCRERGAAAGAAATRGDGRANRHACVAPHSSKGQSAHAICTVCACPQARNCNLPAQLQQMQAFVSAGAVHAGRARRAAAGAAFITGARLQLHQCALSSYCAPPAARQALVSAATWPGLLGSWP